MIKYVKFEPHCPAFLRERASELLGKAISLFTLALGIRAPRWQQITEAGRLWPGHHCGRPPVHCLWHPNIRGSRNHCRDRVSASRACVGGLGVRGIQPASGIRSVRAELAVGFLPFFLLYLEVGVISSVFPTKLPLTTALFKSSLWPLNGATAGTKPRVSQRNSDGR